MVRFCGQTTDWLQLTMALLDFLALEHMAMGVSPASGPLSGSRGQLSSEDNARFSRYIRTVQEQNYRNANHAEALVRAMA